MKRRNLQLQVKTVRQYKDRVFRMLYEDKERFLELYNALNETAYANSDDLTVTTLESAIYLGMKNDVSYLVYDELALYEHQSTLNPNMPLRDLLYVSHIYSDLTKDENMFGSKMLKIPEPQFIVFYNGTEEVPEQFEQRLSNAYECVKTEPALELKVKVLNINHGHNKDLMDKCKSLKDYSIFVAKSREYSKQMDLADAIELAISECIEEDVMADFLRGQRAEVFSVSLFEFNEELYRKCLKEEAMEQGMKEGMKQGEMLTLVRLIRKKMGKGMSVDEISEVLEVETDTVKQIYEILSAYPDADDTQLYKFWKGLH